MAESLRCGRRKQRNPRRKNEDENATETTQKLAITDVTQKDDDESDVTETETQPDTDSCQGDTSTSDVQKGDISVKCDIASDVTAPTSPNANEDLSIKMSDKRDASDVTFLPVIRTERNATLKAMAGLVVPVLSCHADRTAGRLTEDDRIQELLNRSDTAIIYPEPVSDHDDGTHGNRDDDNNDDATPTAVSDDDENLSEPEPSSPAVPGGCATDEPGSSCGETNQAAQNCDLSNDIHSNESKDDDSKVSGGDGEYMLTCPHCSKGFTRTYLLQEHIRSAHGDKVNKHQCPKCEHSFSLKSQLDKHLSLHSTTSQICTICNKTFANVYRLQRHMISHDESTDLRKFKCPECNKAFKFKHHLKEHIRIHSGEKPFECSNCGKRFSHSGSYSSHMTSKKCWVVNMRMKKPDASSPTKPGEDSSRPASGEERRPLQPKGGEDNNAADMSMQSIYANQYRSFLPMDPATAAQYLAAAQSQFNGPQPYLPYAGFPGHMINPILSGLANQQYTYALLSGKKDNALKTHRSKTDLEEGEVIDGMPPQKTMKLETIPVKEEQQADENQNTQTDPAAVIEIRPIDEDQPESDKTEIKNEGSDEISESGEEGVEETNEKDSESTNGELTKEASVNPQANMNEIKKVLEIMGNTVAQQKEQQKDDNVVISKLPSGDDSDAKVVTEDDDERQISNDQSDGESSIRTVKDTTTPCRYCQESFSSPVSLHQHERYLCKQNSAIRLSSELSPARKTTHSSPTPSPMSLVSSVSLNHSTTSSEPMIISPMTQADMEKCSEDENSASQGEVDGFIDKEGRQYRVRSMLTDDQQRILKAHYAVNPRPNKFELLQIANAVSFPKRVVQVWFQNMRARDRRRGNHISTSVSGSTTCVATAALLASTDKLTNGSAVSSWTTKTTPTTTTPYIPVVPQLNFSMLTNSTNVVYPYSSPAAHPNKLNGHMSSPSSSGSPHTPTPSPANLAFTMQLEPLDLSTKKSPSTSLSSTGSPPVTPNHRLHNGEGEEEDGVLNLSKRSNSPRVADIPSLEKTLENSSIFKYMQQEGMIQNGHSHTTNSDAGTASSHSNRSTPNLHPPLVRPGLVDSQLPTESAVFPAPAVTHGSHIGSPLMQNRGSPVLVLRSPSRSPPSSLESSFNSTMSLDSAGLENGLIKKRSRKKSWRQVGLPMESEQVAMEFDNALLIDEDSLSRSKKARKSWKSHKVDVEQGMYACDQCDRLFNKQSSLARHKYEHSGARPFSCGECGKAFKHKHHLTEHRRLHSGEKPFVCTKCGKRFSHSGSFSQHMNHRYKYCKPLRGSAAATSENESGSEHGSEPSAMADTIESAMDNASDDTKIENSLEVSTIENEHMMENTMEN